MPRQNNGTVDSVLVLSELVIHCFRCFKVASVVISAITSCDKTAVAIAHSVNDFDFHNEMVVLTFYVQLTSFFHFSYLFLSGVLFVPPLDTMYYSTRYIPCQYLFKIFRKFFCNFPAFYLRFPASKNLYTIISRRWCGVYPLQP
nr:MAG TPA: hypothetical protein [Caudoviricetes sp.]